MILEVGVCLVFQVLVSLAASFRCLLSKNLQSPEKVKLLEIEVKLMKIKVELLRTKVKLL
jgi:hypothetical protein